MNHLLLKHTQRDILFINTISGRVWPSRGCFENCNEERASRTTMKKNRDRKVFTKLDVLYHKTANSMLEISSHQVTVKSDKPEYAICYSWLSSFYSSISLCVSKWFQEFCEEEARSQNSDLISCSTDSCYWLDIWQSYLVLCSGHWS